MKRCFKCGKEKSFSDFYKHKAMADGHLGKCKDCAKADVQANYAAKTERYTKYYAEREKTDSRKDWKRGALKQHRARYPEKNRARQRVALAIRQGKLKPQPCEICGVKAHAHHDDYSKPLEVRWLCPKHHKLLHLGRL